MTQPAAANSELFGQGFVYTTSTALQLSAGLFILPAATRVLGPATFGAVATVLVIVQILTILAAFGFPAAVSRGYFAPELGEGAGRRLVGAGLLCAAGVTLAAMISSPYWGPVFRELEQDKLLLAAVSVGGVSGMVQVGLALLRARGSAWRFAAVALITSVGGHGLGLLFALLIQPEAIWYLTGMTLGAGMGLILALMATRLGVPNRALVRWALALGAPTIPHSLGLYVMHAGDRIIVERFMGLAEVGRYHVAYVIGGLAMTLITALNNVWAPLIYGAEEDDRRAVLVFTSRSVHRMTALLSVGLALLAPTALMVAAPADFELDGLTPIVAIVSFAAMFHATYLSQVHLLFQHARTKALLWITPSVAAVNIALNVLLLPYFGLHGAALATLVSYGLQAYLVGWARRRIQEVPWDTRAQRLSFLLAAIGCGLGAALPSHGVGTAIRVGLAFVAGVAAILLVLRARRAANAEHSMGGSDSRAPS